MKVPRQCPLVLLVKVDWRGGKTFGCEEGIDERWSRERGRRSIILLEGSQATPARPFIRDRRVNNI
jgi:hypothetical protein